MPSAHYLSDFNHKLSVSKNFSEITQFKILWKSVKEVLSCYVSTDMEKIIGEILHIFISKWAHISYTLCGKRQEFEAATLCVHPCSL